MRQNEWLRKQIEYDTRRFLDAGGKIKQIDPGVSSEYGNRATFMLSVYTQKMEAIERNHGKSFWRVVSELAESGHNRETVARSLGFEPSEFGYLLKKYDRGHLWPIGKNC